MPRNMPTVFTLFDIAINNDSMDEAVQKVIERSADGHTQTVCFVNVNTLNLAQEHTDLTQVVNQSDYVFADGSGVRMAANMRGIELRANVNGTDLLPRLCEQAREHSKSLFLLGAGEGVAQQAADNLQAQFPGLQIAGVHHGFFDKQDCAALIEQINQSGADLLLVALGSPIQERWIEANREALKVDTALAVGGLFDFYSGRIPRAPLWMRELGIEWVWRLMQEPRKKFHRYVIGNPQFLWRCVMQLRAH